VKKVEIDAVAAAAKTARAPELIGEPLALHAERLKQEAAQMLPLERAAKEQAALRCAAIDAQRKLEQDARQVLAEFPDAQVLDPSVFGWRDKKGFPRLAPFSPKSDTVVFVGTRLFSEHFPHSLKGYYKDIAPRLRNSYQELPGDFPMYFIGSGIVGLVLSVVVWCISAFFGQDLPMRWFFLSSLGSLILGVLLPEPQGLSYRIEAQFSGLVPDTVRQVIRRAEQCSGFKEVFILAEVSVWKKSLEPAPVMSRHPDPLVVGFDGARYWLLAKFDVTTLEQAVSDEFASKP
jgi:hypothetical protein